MTAPPPKAKKGSAANGKGKKGSVAEGPAPATGIESFSLKRVALVSHDYDVITNAGNWDWQLGDFHGVNATCEDLGCDAILYAPYTLARRRAATFQSQVFDNTKNLRAIFLEVCDFTSDDPKKPENMEAQAWLKDEAQAFSMYQRFGGSKSSKTDKQYFIDDLPSRRFGDVLCILCGETNIVRTNRTDDKIEDFYQIDNYLGAEGISIILNPVHDYMVRWEMKKKRRHLSRNERIVLSVWNMGKEGESKVPWTVFHDGHDRTDEFVPVDSSKYRGKIRDDVRIGVVDLAKL